LQELVPTGDQMTVSFVDRLDEIPFEKAKASPPQSASPEQPREMEITPVPASD
jgi:hypothetical protein